MKLNLKTSLCIASAFISVSSVAKSKEHSPDKPNVLFIAIDDLNDWVTCLGGYRGKISTPNLDRLSNKGILFTNAHCAVPASAPSRAGIMTGIAAYNSGMYANQQVWRNVERLKDAITIPEYFRENGYRVVGGGKIFHALSWLKNRPGRPGQDGDNDPKCWDEYFPNYQRCMPPEVYPEGWPESHKIEGRPAYFDWGPLPDEKEVEMADYKVTDWAISELNKKHDKPFFQAVGIFRPHIPWFVPQKYYDLYPIGQVKLPIFRPDDLDDAWDHGRRSWHTWIVKNNLWYEAIQGYLASISFCDAQLGRLLDALDNSSYKDNTIIVLWSDHGFHLGEKENWEKFTLWEQSTRVTFMIYSPWVKGNGKSCDNPVSLLDIYPTLNELCGFDPRKDLDGISLVPQLNDPKMKSDRAVVTTWLYNNHAIRDNRYRYINYNNQFEELYDHKTDPEEFNNLIFTSEGKTKYADVVDRMKKWLPKTNVKDPDSNPAFYMWPGGSDNRPIDLPKK